MIRDNSAALIVSSTTNPISGVSARLDLQPSSTREMGAETFNSRRIPPGSEPRYERDHQWAYEVDDDDPADETGFAAVRKLLDALAGKEADVRDLHKDFDVWIVWSGFSDSETGGFVIPAELLPRLALLECDIFASVDLVQKSRG